VVSVQTKTEQSKAWNYWVSLSYRGARLGGLVQTGVRATQPAKGGDSTMAELAKPNGAADSRPAGPSTNGRISPQLALLIEVGVPLALVALIAFVGASPRFSEMFSTVDALPSNLEAAAVAAGNSLSVDPKSNTGAFLPIEAASPYKAELGRHRFRLGDTVYAGKVDFVPQFLRSPLANTHYFYCSVTDDRVEFKAAASAPAQKRGDASPTNTLYAVTSISSDFPGLRLVGYAEPNPKAQQMNPASQSAIPPQSKMYEPPPAKETSPRAPNLTMPSDVQVPNSAASPSSVPAQNVPANSPAQAASSLAATKFTTPEIVTAATMTALLQADKLGITSIAVGPLGVGARGLSDQDSSKAVISGVTRLYDRLGSVSQIFVVERIDPALKAVIKARRFLIPRAAWLWRLHATPLPLPGNILLIEPQPIDYKTLPANRDSLVNSIYRVTPESTSLPAIAFPLVGFFALFAGRRRYASGVRGISLRGFIDGVALTVGLVVTLAILWHFWQWHPERWIASASGLTCAAIAMGALEGGLLAALHQIPPSAHTGIDPALRTVLYRDTPVEDIAHDRLGFGAMVNALRRFLDNPDTAPPVVLSVNGPWGSGKSSVMKMLSRELGKTGRFRIVWFNAWQYHREEQILAAFLQTIARQLSAQWGPVFALRLGWVRWRNTNLLRQVAVVAVLAIVAAGILRPDLRHTVAGAVGEAAASHNYRPLVQVLLGGASIGTLGGIIWAVNILWPFRLNFVHYFQTSDQSRRVGFIDEFTREFRLYREAVGNQKFLFLIDDLDRCQPDRIVDVLKAINLIITSTNEAGRSFFMLGYDQRYIVEAVEQHFADLAKIANEPGQRFGLQYLKKMVTLSVSVPQPSAEQVQELLRRVDTEREPTAQNQQLNLSRPQRLRYAAKRWTRRAWRAAIDPTFARQASLALGFLALALFLVVPRTPTTKLGTPSTAAGSSSSPLSAADLTFNRVPIDMPSPSPPPNLFNGSLLWTIPVLLLFSAGAALYAANRPALIEAAYRREPKDSARFVNAVKWCKDLLPKNPRDAIRMVNLMRMEYLVQESEKAPLDGTPLDEWECVSLTILEKRHPAVFQRLLTELDGPAVSNGDAVGKFNVNDDSGIARDISTLAKAGASTSHIGSIDKLKRFVGVNRFLLEAEL
jgi:KAP family P-loop domain